MSGRQDVADVVTRMLHAVDTLDWSAARATLADKVEIDYTSLFGGEVETLDADALVERWQGLLPGFDATQHLTGPVLVSDLGSDTASCLTQVRAYHYLVDGEARRVWMVAGRYRIRLHHSAGAWRISAITLSVLYEEGDRSIVERATERVANNTGGRTGN